MGEVKKMESIWNKTARPAPRPTLPGDLRTQAVVIGAGMAGILTAKLLQDSGVETVVLEAGRMGCGQTGNTTAKITAQHGAIYGRLIRELGREAALQYAAAQTRAVEAYGELVERENISCSWRRLPAWLYTAGDPKTMEEEAAAEREAGLPARFLSRPELPVPASAGVELPAQALFHPLEFLQGVARDLTVYENTRVVQAEEGRVTTPMGTVEAKHIIFACHFPFPRLPGYYFLRMHQERSYILALENAAPPPAMAYSVDPGGLSLRPWGNSLLLGGAGHPTGQNSAGGRYRELASQARQYWPGCREAARWSAQDCITLDGVPYIGEFSAGRPGWYVATGFGKWGMTNSMAAAMVIRGLITRQPVPWGAVFSPERFRLSPSAKALAEHTAQAFKGLGRRLLAPPRALVEQLPLGHGGIVEVDGEKLGVYKDESGEFFVVDPRCPHLGCQLEWNPDEKSWDCPCHGSRFDYFGRLLDGPAQEDLSPAP
jgi:glycine/D-amino acid oxidase-like deaminating enzyme/nitrite reductase/ring-hydroxylating ferredoxin subunit